MVYRLSGVWDRLPSTIKLRPSGTGEDTVVVWNALAPEGVGVLASIR
jgi:hypothetical protein